MGDSLAKVVFSNVQVSVSYIENGKFDVSISQGSEHLLTVHVPVDKLDKANWQNVEWGGLLIRKLYAEVSRVGQLHKSPKPLASVPVKVMPVRYVQPLARIIKTIKPIRRIV